MGHIKEMIRKDYLFSINRTRYWDKEIRETEIKKQIKSESKTKC